MQDENKRTGSLFDAQAAMEGLFATSSQPLAVLDTDLRFRFVNQRFADLQRCAIADIIGKTPGDIWPVQYRLIGLMQQVIATGQPMYEIPLIDASPRDDDTQTDVLATYVALKSAAGVIGVGIIGQDATEHARANASQQRAMDRFKYIALATNDGIWDLDVVANKVWWNPRLYELLDYRIGVDEPSSQKFAARVHSDERDWLSEEFKESMQNTYLTWQRSFRLVLSDGLIRHVMDRAYFLRDEQGNLRRAIGAVTDITDIKRAEEALVASQLRFQLAASTGGIWDWREDTGPFMSQRFLELLEHRSGDPQITTQRWRAMLHPEDRQRAIALMTAHIRDRTPYEDEYRIQVRSGGYRWFQVSGQAVWNAAGRATYMAGTITDITARKTAEQELRASEERYRLLVELSPDAVMVHRDSVLLFANPAAARLLGYSSGAELVGRGVREFLAPGEESRLLNQKLPEPELRGMVRPIERHLLRADGEVAFVESTSAIVDFEGAPAVQVVCRDISERRRVQEEVRRLNDTLEQRVRDRTAQLQAANQELESFSYSVSHDLRAPLRHMSAFASLLSEKPAVAEDPQSLQHARSIIRAAARLGQLVDDLLMFSRMGRAQLNYATLSTQLLVEHARRELESDAAGRTIEWQIGQLPDVVGDASMLRQVWTNLFSNAMKYTRPRPVARVQVGAESNATETIFFVRDNGVGFDPRYAEKLFGVFERLHSIQEFEGTGIGLANVRRIVQRHGGRVWAQATVDAGATFYFSLPHRVESITAP